MGKIIILGSEKGGVAKTTSTFNLAYALAEEGKKVLAVDFDSQANLSTCFGIEDTAAVPVTVGHPGECGLYRGCGDIQDLQGILQGHHESGIKG